VFSEGMHSLKAQKHFSPLFSCQKIHRGLTKHNYVVCSIAKCKVFGYMVAEYGVAEHEVVKRGDDKQVELNTSRHLLKRYPRQNLLGMKPRFHQD